MYKRTKASERGDEKSVASDRILATALTPLTLTKVSITPLRNIGSQLSTR